MLKNLSALLLIMLMFIQCEYPDPKDRTAPIVVILFPYTNSVISANTQIKIEASDDDKISKVSCYLDGELIGNATKSPYLIDLDVSGSKDGLVHHIQATAEDPEGNIGYSQEINFIIAKDADVTDPTVSILNPQNGQTVQGTVRIVALAEDERSVAKLAFFIDGDSVGETDSYPYNYDWNTAPYADSTNHTLFAKAFDGGGNTATSNAVTVIIFPRDYVIGNTIPVVTVLYPRNASSIYGAVNIVAEATDDEAVQRVEFYVDAVLVSTDYDASNGYSYLLNTTPYADGKDHIIYAKAYDIPGNSGLSPVITVTINSKRDVSQPTTSVLYPINNSVVSGTINVIAEAIDDIGVDRVKFYIDGVLSFTDMDGSNGWSYIWDTNPFADGKTHIVYVEASDTSGNAGLSTITTVTVASTNDIIPPSVSVLYPTNGSIISGTINFTADANDDTGIDRVEFFVDGNIIFTDSDGSDGWSYTWNTASYIDGKAHIVYVKAFDTSGNSATSTTNSITVTSSTDITPPTATVLYPTNNTTIFGTVNIIAQATDDIKVDKVEFLIDGDVDFTDSDGSDGWNYNWDTTPVADGKPHTIYVKAYDTSGNSGLSTTILVTVTTSSDVTPPTVAVLYPTNGSTISGIINVIAEASDNVGVNKVEFYIDGILGFTDSDGSDGWSYSWDSTPYADNQTHVVYAKAYDTSGNKTSSTTAAVTVTLSGDVTTPTVSILYPTNGSTIFGTVNIAANANDNVGVNKVEFYVDGALLSTDSDGSNGWNYSWNTASYADNQNHTIYAKAFDTSGNSTISTTTTVTVSNGTDFTPPTVVLTYPTNGSTVTGNVSVSAEASDNVAVTKVEFYIDGTLSSTDSDGSNGWHYIWNSTPLADNQAHLVYAKAYDATNNSTVSAIASVIVATTNDITPPIITVAYPTNGSTVVGIVNVAAQATDNIGVSKVEFYVDGVIRSTDSDGSNGWNYSWNTAAFADNQNHTIYAKAFDAANNSTISAIIGVIVSATIDQTPPTAVVTNPVNGSTVYGTVNIAVEATDNVAVTKVEFYVDGTLEFTDSNGSNGWSFSWNTTPYADNQNHTVYAKAFDAANNSATSAIVSVTVTAASDITPPIVTMLNPSNGSIVSGTIAVTANATDNISVAKVEFYIDGTLSFTDSDGSNGWSYSWNTTPFANNQNHVIYAKAYDTSNNISTSATTTVTVAIANDNVPPTVTLLYPVDGLTLSGIVNVTADVVDNGVVTSVEFYIDGALVSTDTNGTNGWAYSWDTAPYAGGQQHSVYVKAFDAGGNAGTSGLVTVTIP